MLPWREQMAMLTNHLLFPWWYWGVRHRFRGAMMKMWKLGGSKLRCFESFEGEAGMTGDDLMAVLLWKLMFNYDSWLFKTDLVYGYPDTQANILTQKSAFHQECFDFFWLKLGVRPQGSSQLHLWCSTKATVDPPEERKRSGPRSIRKVSTQICRKICPKTTMSRARQMWLFQDMKKVSPNHGI